MRYENMVQTYNDKNTGIIANISFLCDKKKVHLYKEDSFNETIMLPFEHMSIACPIGFDDNLKSQYGNYMEFVTGTSMHGGLFFDTGKSYMEYKGISYKEFCDLFE